jgi:hypothetical protein
LDEKWRYAPSCDQRGLELEKAGEVRRTGSPPAVGTIQTSECRSFSPSFTVVTVKATCRPSGDMAGEDTVWRRYQSWGVKALPWVAGAAVATLDACARTGAGASAGDTARERAKKRADILRIGDSGRADRERNRTVTLLRVEA